MNTLSIHLFKRSCNATYSPSPDLSLPTNLTHQPQTTSRRTDLCDAVDPAHCALVPGVVLGTAVWAGDRRHAAVDGCEASRANIEVGELVKVNLDDVAGVSLGDRLDTVSLLLHLGVAGAVEQSVGKVQRRVELLVLVGKHHGC